MTSPYDDGPNGGRAPRGSQPRPGGYPPPRPDGPPPGRPLPPVRPGQGPGPGPRGGGGQPPRRPGPPPQGDQRAPRGPGGPGGQPPRRPGPPPQRPGPGARDAEQTRRAERPDQSTKKISANTLSEAVAQRGQRGGTATRPRPSRDGNRPPSGPITGGHRAAGGGTPPSGPPPRRGGGGSGGSGGSRRPQAKKKSPWRIVRRVLYVMVALAIVVPSAVFLVAYTTAKVPQPGDLKTNQVATILAADGTSEISKIVPPEGNRTDVAIDQIPPHVRNAVLAAEDRDFYTNPGFSISGFVRAARDNAMGKDSAGGGSTITQQYVKNSLVGNQRSVTRKMRELVISAKMARQWSKDDILAAYLNTIPFGRGTFGIDAAAHAYFDKPVQALSVEEGAVLAATIQQPYGLDPDVNPKGAESRWNYVLDGMVGGGTLQAADRQKMTYPHVRSQSEASEDPAGSGPEGLIKRQVMRELSDAGISDTQLNTEGLQITTTIDSKMQQAAVNAAQKNMQGEPDQLRTAVVSVDPKTGAVKAYYGGQDGQGYDFANAGLMPGSSFKAFGLAANLEQGKPLSTMYDSGPLTVNGIKITNVEGESCGTCTIAEALKRSLNTSFYRMQLDMKGGPQKIADMAHKLGIPDTIPGVGKTLVDPDGGPPNNGIVLGQYQARPLDMASAYATLAASGMYHKPHFVSKVVTADGEVLLDRGDVAGEQRVPAPIADNVTSAMQPIAGWSRHHDLAGGRASAAKTGTAQLGETGENRDAWMVGYTPSLSTAVWIGTEQGEKLRNASGGMIYGSGLPSDIWKDTMDGALKGTPNENFPKPAPIAGQAGVPSWTAAYTAPSTTQDFVPPVVVQPSQVEILPGVTIPVPGLVPNPQSQQRQQPQGQQGQGQQQDSGQGPLPGQPVAPTGEPGAGDGNSPGTGNGASPRQR
ncbi:peptidoglycan glycosyltransferase [Nocardia mexicana]|uniref:Peptidoglycan glycosyltransferase n=2 Tax=Nocardia mexicana TaxID=279262 RepID=A0A370GUF5_9NOCA|nr:peptidoglycan glycosyltransferase [Nocardia mexicana]